MSGPVLLALVGGLALLALIPARRLYRAGWPSGVILGYWVALILLGLLVAELRGPARFLVPILIVAYVAPFVTARESLARLFGADERPPMKDVTPRSVEPIDRKDRDPGDEGGG